MAADALSRKFEEGNSFGLSAVHPKLAEDIIESYQNDAGVQHMITQPSVDTNAAPGAQLQDDILRQNGKVWVGSHGSLRQRLVNEMHSSPWAGHSGIHATQQRLRSLFYWPTLLQGVKN